MLKVAIHIALLLIVGVLSTIPAAAQHISFGLYATDGIDLIAGSVNELNFNTKQTIILAGNTVTIDLAEEATAILTINGRTDLDVTVTIDADPTLYLDEDNEIPLSIGFAYSNLGASSETIAKTQAIMVPTGFTSATFPVLRRSAGQPGPPPTPDHTGYTQPTGTAYLFIYGTLGPVPQNAAVGLYTGTINITVEYSVFE